ncbi:MAG: glycosyltransferase family 9 protein [Verrucomicrobia bacterium]|nr:glycosyltransferase family 9 protein [Verrucomicrobiota bacterium]
MDKVQAGEARSPRILLVKLSSLGDLFHALPLVRVLKRELGARIDWVTQAPYADLVRCFDDVDDVIVFPRKSFLRSLRSFRSRLRQEEYDLVLDLQGLLKSAFVAGLARSRRKLGPSYCREGSHIFYGEIAGELNKERHAVEEGLDFARHLDLSVGEPEFPMSFPSLNLSEGRPRIALIPCSRWETKNWPVAHFVDAGKMLRRELGATLFLFGAPEDGEICRQIAAGCGDGVVDQCGKTSLIEMGSWLSEMDLVITVDSGPMHMAAALQKPVLAIFGPTDPVRTGPFGDRCEVLYVDYLSCRPCFSRSCLRDERDVACLKMLSPERVAATAAGMLEMPQTPPS